MFPWSKVIHREGDHGAVEEYSCDVRERGEKDEGGDVQQWSWVDGELVVLVVLIGNE